MRSGRRWARRWAWSRVSPQYSCTRVLLYTFAWCVALKRDAFQRVMNHHEDYHLDEIPRLTGGRGADVIIENLANVNLGKDLGALATRGRVVVVGSRGEVTIDPRHLMMRDAEVRGMALMNISDRERDSIHAAIHIGLENGTLNPVVSREMSLADAAQAHHAVIESSTHGKIVFIP